MLRKDRSSNIYEVIRVILNIFLRKDSKKAQKAQEAKNRTKSEQKTKKTFLNAFKKHLKGRKSPIRLFAFLCFFCL